MADTALEFLAAGRALRDALVADAEEREFARQVRNSLARVYLAAALLGPPTTAETDDDPPGQRPAAGESSALRETLKARFGEHALACLRPLHQLAVHGVV